MNDRSSRISRLLNSQKSRAAYIKSKLSVLVPAQIRSLRLKSQNPPMPYQRDLARAAEMHQSRISMFETPGMANVTLETLSKIAAALRVGLIVKFVPYSDMLHWENSYSPDFDVIRLEQDSAFLKPAAASEQYPNSIAIFGALAEAFETEYEPGEGIQIARGNTAAAAKRPASNVAAYAQAAVGGR